MIIALVISFTAGIVSAMKKGTWLDHIVTFIAILGLSMPNFWLGIMLIIIFAVNLHWLPAIGYSPLSDGFWPWFSHLILPAIAVGAPFAAIIARMIRSAMLGGKPRGLHPHGALEGLSALGHLHAYAAQRADSRDHGDGHVLHCL